MARAFDRIHKDSRVLGVPTANGRLQTRLVWKSIESLGRLGVILTAVPEARAVHLLRHPCGYVASVLRGEAHRQFVDRRPSSDDYDLLAKLMQTEQARRRGLTLEQLKAAWPVERLAWRWVLLNEKAMEDTQGIGRCVTVRYEDVCAEPVKASKAFFGFAGLRWDSQTESFIAASTTTDNASYYSIFKHPAQAAIKWKSELDRTSIDKIRQIAENSRAGCLYFDEERA
jgi:hypothetical protein